MTHQTDTTHCTNFQVHQNSPLGQMLQIKKTTAEEWQLDFSDSDIKTYPDLVCITCEMQAGK